LRHGTVCIRAEDDRYLVLCANPITTSDVGGLHKMLESLRNIKPSSDLSYWQTMDNFYIKATAISPEVDFRFDQHVLTIKGESYPENAAAFYAPIVQQLRNYLSINQRSIITANISLTYFNSSSTKMLFSIFDVLDQAAQAGNQIQVNWYHDEEDETIFEFGEELKADFTSIVFKDHPLSTG